MGIKDATGRLEYTSAIAEALPGFNIYSGNDDIIYDVLDRGGKGVISVVANIYPQQTHDLCANYLNGNKEEAKQIQDKLNKVIDHLFVEPNPIPVKYAMKHLDMIPSGTLRLPLTDLSEKFRKGLIDALDN